MDYMNDIEEYRGILIKDLNISRRAKSAFRRAKYHTLYDLIKKRNCLNEVVGLGDVMIKEINEFLDSLGYKNSRQIDKDDAGKNSIDNIEKAEEATYYGRLSKGILKYSIEKLQLNVRAMNALKAVDVKTIEEIVMLLDQDELKTIKNVGASTIKLIKQEIEKLVNLKDGYFDQENYLENTCIDVGHDHNAEEATYYGRLSKDILKYSIEKLQLNARAMNALKAVDVKTIEEIVMLLDQDELKTIKNVGASTIKLIKQEIEKLVNLKDEYFGQENHLENTYIDVGYDYNIIDILLKEYKFKATMISKWLGVSRQSVLMNIKRRAKGLYKKWTGYIFTDTDAQLLNLAIHEKKFTIELNGDKCYLFNNKKDNCICIMVYKNQIKCFFLKDLPNDTQRMLIKNNFHRFTERELSTEISGEIKYRLKKAYFVPNYADKFRQNAKYRNMTAAEYSEFICGLPLGDFREVDDERVIKFLESNLENGQVYISSDSKNQWIRSLASRNNYSISDLIRLFGYEPRYDGLELSTEAARTRHIKELSMYIVHDNFIKIPIGSSIYRKINTYSSQHKKTINEYISELGFRRIYNIPNTSSDLEEDMQSIAAGELSDNETLDQIFERYPLLGSKILDEGILELINNITIRTLSMIAENNYKTINKNEKMKITLAIVNAAKGWSFEKNSEFWRYIVLQFGYRCEGDNKLIRFLQDIFESTLKENHKIFLEDQNGREFKTTVLMHAFASKKSWIAVFELLLIFYKNNLRDQVVEIDDFLEKLFCELKNKITYITDNQETVIEISSKVYDFEEGVKKLILYRPKYTKELFKRILVQIDAMEHSRSYNSQRYEELLCTEWYQNRKFKINNLNNSKVEKISNSIRYSYQKNLTVSSSKIKARLFLKDEVDLVLFLPEIQLQQDNFEKAILQINMNSEILLQKEIPWYGNELGKTLTSVAVSIADLGKPIQIENLGVSIFIDEKELYSCAEILDYDFTVFSGEKMVNIGNLKQGKYTFIFSESKNIVINNAVITEIPDFKVSGVRALYVELNEGFSVIEDKNVLVSDTTDMTGNIYMELPPESEQLPILIRNNITIFLAYKDSFCSIHLNNKKLLDKLAVYINNKRIDFSDLQIQSDGNSFIIKCPLYAETNECRLDVRNRNEGRVIFEKAFYLISKIQCTFNREVYYNEEDFNNAYVAINVDNFYEEINFSRFDDFVSIPFQDGMFQIDIPKLEIEEINSDWLTRESSDLYIEDIPKESVLVVKKIASGKVIFDIDGISYQSNKEFPIGNILRRFDRNSNKPNAVVKVKVIKGKNLYSYKLADVYFEEQFLRKPILYYENNKLFWNISEGFIGQKDRKFQLELSKNNHCLLMVQIDKNIGYTDIPASLEVGEYKYSISILMKNIFKKIRKEITSGVFTIGDINQIRFSQSYIVIKQITVEDNGVINIKPCVIENIQFKGLENTPDGWCPVYQGDLYTKSYGNGKYYFSSKSCIKQSGVEMLIVNPVRIVYISDRSICITDQEKDGLYCYKNGNRYEITDRSFTEYNKSQYLVPDLYLYYVERV